MKFVKCLISAVGSAGGSYEQNNQVINCAQNGIEQIFDEFENGEDYDEEENELESEQCEEQEKIRQRKAYHRPLMDEQIEEEGGQEEIDSVGFIRKKYNDLYDSFNTESSESDELSDNDE
ncbi:MAG: hypothetical protein EZS28_049861 [Streblomastix strix]|uniref:Uncharacterized protein n=1 Tax=Streblomastix strix TaxID=222440 RepID=A0A5J4T9F9_9EUKA|nr:MAG: hypothetical protein EZS28_049861 [Streblomastix strix]